MMHKWTSAHGLQMVDFLYRVLYLRFLLEMEKYYLGDIKKENIINQSLVWNIIKSTVFRVKLHLGLKT